MENLGELSSNDDEDSDIEFDDDNPMGELIENMDGLDLDDVKNFFEMLEKKVKFEQAMIDKEDDDGETALMTAISSQKWDIVTFLLEKGASVNVTDSVPPHSFNARNAPVSSRYQLDRCHCLLLLAMQQQR